MAPILTSDLTLSLLERWKGDRQKLTFLGKFLACTRAENLTLELMKIAQFFLYDLRKSLFSEKHLCHLRYKWVFWKTEKDPRSSEISGYTIPPFEIPNVH